MSVCVRVRVFTSVCCVVWRQDGRVLMFSKLVLGVGGWGLGIYLTIHTPGRPARDERRHTRDHLTIISMLRFRETDANTLQHSTRLPMSG